MNINDIKIGTQIVFDTSDINETQATCIFIDEDYFDFVAEIGSFNIQKNNFDEIINNFNVKIIDDTHPKWEIVNDNSFKFFEKLNDLEQKLKRGEIEDEEIDFLKLLEELGDEFDKEM